MLLKYILSHHKGKNLGMNIAYAKSFDHRDMGQIEGYIKECAEDNTELLMIVLPRKSSSKLMLFQN